MVDCKRYASQTTDIVVKLFEEKIRANLESKKNVYLNKTH